MLEEWEELLHRLPPLSVFSNILSRWAGVVFIMQLPIIYNIQYLNGKPHGGKGGGGGFLIGIHKGLFTTYS
jgi:hypothetical protein